MSLEVMEEEKECGCSAEALADMCSLHTRAQEMLEMLRELEWSFIDGGDSRCPVCGGYQDERRHDLQCNLETLLGEIDNG